MKRDLTYTDEQSPGLSSITDSTADLATSPPFAPTSCCHGKDSLIFGLATRKVKRMSMKKGVEEVQAKESNRQGCVGDVSI